MFYRCLFSERNRVAPRAARIKIRPFALSAVVTGKQQDLLFQTFKFTSAVGGECLPFFKLLHKLIEGLPAVLPITRWIFETA